MAKISKSISKRKDCFSFLTHYYQQTKWKQWSGNMLSGAFLSLHNIYRGRSTRQRIDGKEEDKIWFFPSQYNDFCHCTLHNILGKINQPKNIWTLAPPWLCGVFSASAESDTFCLILRSHADKSSSRIDNFQLVDFHAPHLLDIRCMCQI